MKGKYSGRHMTIYGYVMPGAVSLARWAEQTNNLSDKARLRLQILDWLRTHDNNISLTARHFGLDRETVRIWRDKLQKVGLEALNDQSHKPKRLRRPTTGWAIVNEIVKIRKQYPAWSKHKLQPLVSAKGYQVSVSTVGRILKRKDLINHKISRKRQKAAKHPRRRYPRGLRINSPGDMIQIDTKHIALIGGQKIYQFTAIDVLTKQRVLNYHSSLASKNGRLFLEECLNIFPFPIRAIQTDNGPEFQKGFRQRAEELKLDHYYIYPRTPKQNSYVETSHSADQREFYGQGKIGSDIEAMRRRIKAWQDVWNQIRPHEALDYLTPAAYYHKWQTSRLPTKDTITLQT